MKISLFTDDCEKPVNMLLYRRSKKEYVKAIEAAGLEVLEVSDRTLGELDALGVWRRKTRESFDKSSMNVMKLLGLETK